MLEGLLPLWDGKPMVLGVEGGVLLTAEPSALLLPASPLLRDGENALSLSLSFLEHRKKEDMSTYCCVRDGASAALCTHRNTLLIRGGQFSIGLCALFPFSVLNNVTFCARAEMKRHYYGFPCNLKHVTARSFIVPLHNSCFRFRATWCPGSIAGSGRQGLPLHSIEPVTNEMDRVWREAKVK
jgi:hypothetical protein